jgi:hypothetical protein
MAYDEFEPEDIDIEDEEHEEDEFFFDDEHKGERLFFIRAGHYTQYTGEGDYPPEVEAWMKANNGDLPPFMPLPTRPVEFHVDEEWGGRYSIPWPGHGPLPEPVLNYVAENGTLPRNSAIQD